MQERWKRKSLPVLLVGMKMGAATLELSMEIPQENSKEIYPMTQTYHALTYT